MKTKPLIVWATRDQVAFRNGVRLDKPQPGDIVHLWTEKPRRGLTDRHWTWFADDESECTSECPYLPVGVFKVWVGKLPPVSRPLRLSLTATLSTLVKKRKTPTQKRADKFYAPWLSGHKGTK